MNKNFIIVLLSLVIGVLSGLFIYKEYKANYIPKEEVKGYEKIYLLQIGAYKKEKNVEKFTKLLPNYYVDYEKGVYHIYIGVLRNLKNLDKIEEFYKVFGNNIYVREKYVDNLDYIKMIETYESIISKTEKKEVVYVINKELLNKYKELYNERYND